MSNNLVILGLILSFLGSFALLIDSLFSLQRPMVSTIHRKGLRPLEPKRGGGYKSVLISKKEIRMITWLLLITLGFLSQLFGNL